MNEDQHLESDYEDRQAPPIDVEYDDYEEDDDETEAVCPACGEFISYCQGHGALGDPEGRRTLIMHYDYNNHSRCAPGSDCQEAG